MAWPDFFVLCLAVGFVLSVISVLGHGIHIPHLHGHWNWHGAGAGKGGIGHQSGSVFNLFTLAAFLMWFGGSGYVLARMTPWTLLIVMAVATPVGVAGAGIIYWFMARVMMANERPLNPLDYEMAGLLGELTTALGPGRTGEMICAQQGRRIGVAVRSETGETLPRGTEVIVTRYEGGIAYVRTWDELSKQ